MAGIARMAWRNLGRNRRRTFITGLALAIGTALCVGMYGWVDGMLRSLLHSLTRFDLGHVQVHHPDYPRSRSSDHAITPDPVLHAAGAVERVRGVAPRVYSFALVSSEGKSLGVELVGVDPAREPRVTVLHERVIEGRYLDEAPTPWPRGRELTDEERERDRALTEEAEERILEELEALEGLEALDELDELDEPAQGEAAGRERDAMVTREIVLAQSPPPERPPRVLVGASLARTLRAGVGSRIHATGQTVDGQNQEVFLEIAGLFRTGNAQFDRTRMYMHVADLQRFTHLYDQVHEIAVVADAPEHADAVAARLRAALARTSAEDGALVRSWREIRPDMHRMIEISQTSSSVLVFIIFFVATLGVVNTMLMAVFERTRELGVLKAIGLSSGRIVRLIVTETLFLVLAAAAVGTLLGLGLDIYMVTRGIDLSGVTGGFSMAGVGVEPVMYGAITARGLTLPAVILSIMCLLASLYPAIRAARLKPAVGMRET